MLLKIRIAGFALLLSLAACNNETTVTGKFTVNGELKNVPDQQVYLEQIFFSDKNPEVLDTAQIKNGKFSVSAIAPEEGLYRLRLEKQESGFVFINDRPAINFKADLNDVSLEGPSFNTPANQSFKGFLSELNKRGIAMSATSRAADSLAKMPGNDSIVALERKNMTAQMTGFKTFLLKVVDTASDPVIAMFALGYSQDIPAAEVEKSVASLSTRFPEHQGIKGLVATFNQMIAEKNKPAAPGASVPTSAGKFKSGDMAPDFTFKDTEGKSFSLKELRGKYVLVDFWASWCGPCRAENPNVVAAFNKYKNKNFTILGVSLDENKAAWVKAIANDKLNWKQVSDLKGWGSDAVSLYGIEGIPFNVLLDPQGKIIATELRDVALDQKLSEVLK